MSAESSGRSAKRRPRTWLQRGRTQMSAESVIDVKSLQGSEAASTGPHSDECGEQKATILPCASCHASTGPHSDECGEWPPATARTRGTGSFNGAALR